MLKALYDYGVAHPEIILPPKTSMRGIKFVVELTPNGDLVGVRKSEKKMVSCPDIGGATRGSGTTSNILMEKAELSIQLESAKAKGSAAARVNKKREGFLQYFRDGVEAGVEAFSPVLAALETPETLHAIQEAAIEQKVKPGDSVGFALHGVLLSDMPEVKRWWRQQGEALATSSDEKKDVLDLITGELCIPARLHKPIPVKAAGGGQPSGVSLVSFNNRTFESFGLSDGQGRNAPMSQETADTISDALTYLGEHGAKLADMRFIHWYDKDIGREYDILLQGFFASSPDGKDDTEGVDEDAKSAAATKLVEAPITGEPPAELCDCTYHIMLLRPEMSRMSIRYSDTGKYDVLYGNLKKWFADMELVSQTGRGRARYRTINGLLYALLTQEERARKEYDDQMAALKATALKLTIACMQDGPIPAVVLARAIASIKSQIYRQDDGEKRLSPVPFQVLKMYLSRRPGAKKGATLMPELNPKVENIGYQCGRLLAIYDAIQRRAAPEVQTGVLAKFYSACSQHPAMTIGRMQALSIHHLRKIENPYYERLYRDMLVAAYDCIQAGTQIPKRLSAEDQAYFAVGYWQQVAEIGRQTTYKSQKQEEE